MKIIQVLGGDEDGGLEKHVIELCNELVKKNIQITLIAHKKYKSLLASSVDFIELDLSLSRYNLVMLFKLIKILNSIDYDIIHTHANKSTQIINSIKMFFKPTKIISTLHSYKKNTSMFEKSDFVICVSDRISKTIKTLNKITIHNGINVKKIERKENIYKKYGLNTDDFIISSIGRLVDIKGFDVLLKSFVGLNAKLLIVGDGKEKKSLKELSKKLNIEDRVIFTGFIKNIFEIISISNLIVIASSKEGFAYTFAEALLSKKPLIATDVADISKIINQKYIVNYGDNKQLNEKISFFINNYMECYNDFTQAFNFAKENFTLEAMVNKNILVYKINSNVKEVLSSV